MGKVLSSSQAWERTCHTTFSESIQGSTSPHTHEYVFAFCGNATPLCQFRLVSFISRVWVLHCRPYTFLTYIKYITSSCL